MSSQADATAWISRSRSINFWASVASILRFDNSADVPGEKLNTGHRRAIR